MRNILFAAAAAFILLGAGSLLAVFLMPWLLAYGFSAPAGLLMILGGVVLLALAAQIDGLHRLETAIYGLQKSLRQVSRPATSDASVAPVAPVVELSSASPPVSSSVTGPEKPESAAMPSSETSPPTSPPKSGAPETVTEEVIVAEKPQPMTAAASGVSSMREEIPVKPAIATPEKTMAAEEKRRPAAVADTSVQAPSTAGPVATPPVKEGKETATSPEEEKAAVAKPSDEAEEKPAEQAPVSGEEAAIEENGEVAAEEEGFLYIVREEVVRGRKARVLSDGTIEAELDEGWLRFENMEHLNEYLDALEELRKKGML